MNQDKQIHLQQAFPRLFRKDPENPSPHGLFGIECGDGWHDLLYQLCYDIEEALTIAKTADKDWPYVRQVKEKFGSLRFYLSASNLEIGAVNDTGLIEFRPVSINATISRIIERAEAKSMTICEDCSAPGDLYRDTWWHTKCPECEEIYKQKREQFLSGNSTC